MMRIWGMTIIQRAKVDFQCVGLPTRAGQLTKWPYHRRGRPARLRAPVRGAKPTPKSRP